MATFTAAERKLMWEICRLPREQLYESDSVFNCLLDKFEEEDTAAGDLLIPDLQAELALYPTSKAALATLKASGPIQTFLATEEGEVEFVNGATQATFSEQDLKSFEKRMKDLIDPRGILNQFIQRSRAIPTT